jgi:hypothetical protein
MPSRFHWDCGLAKTAASTVTGKLFLASGLCGRASAQQAMADLVKRIQDSSISCCIMMSSAITTPKATVRKSMVSAMNRQYEKHARTSPNPRFLEVAKRK